MAWYDGSRRRSEAFSEAVKEATGSRLRSAWLLSICVQRGRHSVSDTAGNVRLGNKILKGGRTTATQGRLGRGDDPGGGHWGNGTGSRAWLRPRRMMTWCLLRDEKEI